jgi:type IV pilus assembly protein PilB
MNTHPVLEELMISGHLTQEQTEGIYTAHLAQNKPIAVIATESGVLNIALYLETLARLLHTQVIDLMIPSISPEVRRLIPSRMVQIHRSVPVRSEGETIFLAVADIPGPEVADDIAFVLSRPVRFLVASPIQISETIQRFYATDDDSMQDIFEALDINITSTDKLSNDSIELVDLDQLKQLAAATPVIRCVNAILYQAIKDRASDIHFEPFEHEFKIRYRVDGTLCEITPLPQQVALPVISRLKVISGLNIAEKRLPQDGRIQMDIAGRSIDFRVSTLPTQFGESVVLRVLDRSNIQLDIHHIGFPDDVRDLFKEDIQKPNGMLMVTGPTGSGKTTTLYAALQQINTVETKILTAEDPVEYDVEGINQLAVREDMGLSFSVALRSFLRQDPDVIMVGEIRDLETAQIAIQASLTGHLVLSTLHTHDAAGAITRLIDMGIEPFLITSTLDAVLGQRIIRTICTHCKTAYLPEKTDLSLFEPDLNRIGNKPLYRGRGCASCNGSGYRGRQPLVEYMQLNDTLRTLIIDRKPSRELRNKAIQNGMRTLREEGLRAMLNGETTVEEITQYT